MTSPPTPPEGQPVDMGEVTLGDGSEVHRRQKGQPMTPEEREEWLVVSVIKLQGRVRALEAAMTEMAESQGRARAADKIAAWGLER